MNDKLSSLEKIGFDVTRDIGGHGVVGLLENGDGPTVMLRADLDGLPIVEATNFETVFVTISVAVLAGWFCTFRLEEPRHALRGKASATIVPDDD